MKQTALITGASSGIGYALAEIFAEKGHNLILVARRETNLITLATRLKKENGIEAYVIPCDLSKPDASKSLYLEIKGLELTVDLLVNNAGFGDFGEFHELDWQKQADMIQVNITALTQLCHLFLPEMKKNEYGRILNIASSGAFAPLPFMSVYGATKAYVLSFSEALAEEVKPLNITVTALCPGATETEFAETAQAEKSGFFKRKMPTPHQVAQYGYDKMMAGQTVAVHGLSNKILVTLMRLMPRKIVAKTSKHMAKGE